MILNKYILSDDQVDVVKKVYRQLVLDGLAVANLGVAVEKEVIISTNSNLDHIIETTQKVLAEMGVMEEVRLEISRDIAEEKTQAKVAKKKIKNKIK